jgi:hypothetical protein
MYVYTFLGICTFFVQYNDIEALCWFIMERCYQLEDFYLRSNYSRLIID